MYPQPPSPGNDWYILFPFGAEPSPLIAVERLPLLMARIRGLCDVIYGPLCSVQKSMHSNNACDWSSSAWQESYLFSTLLKNTLLPQADRKHSSANRDQHVCSWSIGKQLRAEYWRQVSEKPKTSMTDLLPYSFLVDDQNDTRFIKLSKLKFVDMSLKRTTLTWNASMPSVQGVSFN